MLDEKVQLKVYISKSLDEALRALISKKYKKFRKGYLSAEVEQALSAWIAEHNLSERVNKNTSSAASPKILRVKEEVKNYLMQNFGYKVPHEVLVSHLSQAIAHVRGSDPRTIRKWIKIFTENRCIQWLSHNTVTFLVDDAHTKITQNSPSHDQLTSERGD